MMEWAPGVLEFFFPAAPSAPWFNFSGASENQSEMEVVIHVHTESANKMK